MYKKKKEKHDLPPKWRLCGSNITPGRPFSPLPLLLTATLCFNALDITALENPPEWAELEPGKGAYRISFGCLQRLAVPNNSRLLSLD
jgi:hypothetical protein